jgi:hypothetical protein
VSIKVEFGFANVGQQVDFNDITADVISVTTNRGKDPVQDTFNAATCSISLKNQTRNYDPDYGASPYQGQIVPTGQLRVYSNDQVIFTGFITDWNFSYNPSGESIAEIVAADAFWNLNNQALTEYSPVEQLSSERITSVLSRTEVGGTAVWPASARVISTGLATVGDYDVSDGTNVLSYLQEVEKAEPGRLFIDKSGRIVFRSRNNDLSNPDFEYTRINLSPNPSFENNLRNWTVGTGTFTESFGPPAYIGTNSAILSAGGAVSQFFASDFGVDYTTSVYARASSGTVTVALSALTSTDGSAYSEINLVTAQVGTAGWTRLDTSFNASSLYSGMRIKQQPSSAAVYLDAVLIEASPIADAYFDGSNDPVYNFLNPDEPDYQPERVFESYETEWLL